MSWFSRKTHREKYEGAEKNLERKKLIPYVSPLYLDDVEMKLEELYASGREEALELSKKYIDLARKVVRATSDYRSNVAKSKNREELTRSTNKIKDAYKVLHDFEKNELGMHKRDGVKKNIGTLTGVVSIGSFILAGFLGSNITGNVIANNSTGFNSSIFLAIGFVFGLAWLVFRK